MHFVDFHFSEFFVQSSDLSVPAEPYAGREGSREGETKCLTLPGNSPALTPSFCIYSPPPLRWGRRALLKIDSGFLHLLRRVWQAFFIIIWTGNTPSWIFLPQSLCPSTPPCFVRGPNIKSEQWEGGIYRETKNKACKGLGWLNSFGIYVKVCNRTEEATCAVKGNSVGVINPDSVWMAPLILVLWSGSQC